MICPHASLKEAKQVCKGRKTPYTTVIWAAIIFNIWFIMGLEADVLKFHSFKEKKRGYKI